ncbi:MAG: putative sulfate exporter family transporter, partial [Pseudomonadota bacterium]
MPRALPIADRLAAAPNAAQRLWPGLLTAGLIAAAAQFVADFSGGPALLFALLLGMAMHFAGEDSRVRPGVDAASKTILRIGVMLLGARIGADEIIALGWGPLLLVGAAVFATIGFGVAAARAIGLDRSQGLLTGGATAICGASAALAISAVLPNRPTQDRDTLFAVVAVTSLSTIAMIAYPALVQAIGLSDRAAGVFLGGAIHDVAQVVGAGYIVSVEAGDAAVLTKLFRVALLAPIVIAIAIAFH